VFRLKGVADRAIWPSFRSGDGAEQLPHQPVQLVVLNQASGSLALQGASEQARQAENGFTAASRAVIRATGTDQFALDAKNSGGERQKMQLAGRNADGHRARFLRAKKELPK